MAASDELDTYTSINDDQNPATENSDSSSQPSTIIYRQQRSRICHITSSSSQPVGYQNMLSSRCASENYDFSDQSSPTSYRWSRSSVYNTSLESLFSDLKPWISRDTLDTDDDDTEPDYQPSKVKLTASTAREKMYEKIIQDYQQECDYLRKELKKEKERQHIPDNGLSSSDYLKVSIF